MIFCFVDVNFSRCKSHSDKFISMCSVVGIPISVKKTFTPSTCLSFLGIELDTLKMEARLPPEKVQKCISYINFALSRSKITLRELQQITGLLNFACQVVVPGRAFLRHLVDLSVGV